MTLPRLILPCACLAIACTPASKSLGEGETGDASNASDGPVGDDGNDDAASADDGATSSTPGPTDDGASTGMPSDDGSCGRNLCEPCDMGCDAADVCMDGQWTCICECGGTSDDAGSSGPGSDSGDTGAGFVCEIAEAACAQADQSKSEPIDCGDVAFTDPVADWFDAHQCVLAAVEASEAFKVVFDMQGIDSAPRRALVGMTFESYAMMQLDQDMGGILPVPAPVMYRYCDAIQETADCVIGPNSICLDCLGGFETDVLCEPE